MNQNKAVITEGKAVLGIEFGSTRIKAVLVNTANEPIAQGGFDWENRYVNGIWTYSLEDIWSGLKNCYASLLADVREKYEVDITRLAAIGFSGMMHGYMAFNHEDKLLVPFRTWRNTITEQASEELSKLFQFHIPQRWSIAHLYQAVLNHETHVQDITYITTLAGYIHWKLTGEKVVGVGEASGMFPIDSETKQFDRGMLEKFSNIDAIKAFPWKPAEILPKVLVAGEKAGCLTEEGAKLLDYSGKLQAGCPLCPPEGDAGTGMTATNSVGKRTGNVSAGTSVFAMVVMEKPLAKPYDEIDIVTTPSGESVAMVHCNNCTSDINAWAGVFREFAAACDIKLDNNQLYTLLFNKALEGEADGGGLLSYNYFSGEHITRFEEGRPLFVRTPDSSFTLANFMRVQLYTSLGALKTGLDILLKTEKVRLDRMYGHGGFFKTKKVGQKILAAAINAPVSVMKTAGEGGAWGIAVLASFMIQKKTDETLSDFLNQRVFAGQEAIEVNPDANDITGFDTFMERYTTGLAIERAAVDYMK